MSPLTTILLAAAILGVTAAAPAPQATPPPAPTITCSQNWSPDFYQVFLDYPDHNVTVPNNRSPKDPNQIFYMVQGVHQKDSRGAVISFPSNPTNAQSCTLGWSQSKLGRNLANYGAASALRVWQLELGGKPLTDVVGKVTLNSIKPIIKPGTMIAGKGNGIGSADFGGWAKEAHDEGHTTGSVECAEEMAFYLEFADQEQEGMVVMLQDAANQAGWYVSFTGAC